ncbi:pilus assembly protein TadG-related protein [Streptomyces sp. NBC_01020]|uniref:pilus assembly protein TadG-related protein n=1 Tax=Streptomyces sp. NBC_01020 TaxID=2903722 RepID=UPI003863E8F5|nr:pilus assembly protein TadG-related protein [Streptomyces sp. NBC_01020]
MTSHHPVSDQGQTILIYVVVVGGLLFLAFAYFAFAQAAVARNGAQSAADAAALAAAQNVRDQMTDGMIQSLGQQDDWASWLLGNHPVSGTGYAAAVQFAGENDATLDGLAPTTVKGYPAFEASITTRFTVGKSVIPGTEGKHAKAHAVAMIEPRCSVKQSGDSKLVEFDCDGRPWAIDPKKLDLTELPQPKDLFAVHLAE